MRKLLLGTFSLVLACSKGGEPPSFAGATIYLIHQSTGRDEVWAFLRANPLPDPAGCKLYLNQFEIPGDYFLVGYGEVYAGVILVNSGIEDGTLVKATLVSDLGTVEGSLNLPLRENYREPQAGDTLPLGDVKVSWSGKADFYSVFIYVEARDQADDSVGARWWRLFTRDTSVVIPSDSLKFGGSWDHSFVWVDVDPGAGPMPSGGAKANMSGDLEGFYYLINEAGGHLEFWINSGGKTKTPEKPGWREALGG